MTMTQLQSQVTRADTLQTVSIGYDELLASKASCRTDRPVHRRQTTFMNEYAMSIDRPKPPLAL